MALELRWKHLKNIAKKLSMTELILSLLGALLLSPLIWSQSECNHRRRSVVFARSNTYEAGFVNPKKRQNSTNERPIYVRVKKD